MGRPRSNLNKSLAKKKAPAKEATARAPRRDADAVAFGARLRKAREAAGLSQADLARLVKIPQPRMPRLEQGRTDVRLSTIRRFAKALGISLTDLLPTN
jgi:ribosome-binding protein aMBF1 (putative translation factor)